MHRSLLLVYWVLFIHFVHGYLPPLLFYDSGSIHRLIPWKYESPTAFLVRNAPNTNRLGPGIITALRQKIISGEAETLDNMAQQRTIVRQRDYRNDLLPVEKSLGLVGNFTFREAYKLVKDGRIRVNGRVAKTGEWVSDDDTLWMDDGVPLPRRQVPLSAQSHHPLAQHTTAHNPSRHRAAPGLPPPQ